MAKYKLIPSILYLSLFLVLIPPAFSEEYGPKCPEANTEEWSIITSSHATIYVEKNIDLRGLSRRIDVGFARYDPVERELFLNRGISDEERIANKIDIIVRKDQKTLDMHPHGFHVNIRIYEKDRGLWGIYEQIFKEKKEYKAFYIHKFRTIYISFNNVSESVLAHEIGHSIIDHYFAILPPQKVRELLATYVDVHLKD